MRIGRADIHPKFAAIGQADTLLQVSFFAQGIQQAGHFTGIAAFFILVFFKSIQLLNHSQRNNHVIVLESLQGSGVVNEDVGIENESFNHEA